MSSLLSSPWPHTVRSRREPGPRRPLAALVEAGGGGTHCALEAAVVVEAAPPAEAAVKSALWTDSAEVEAA